MAASSLDRLRLLHSVADTGTIAAAARAQGYTASAVSQQLAALEREVGTILFERSNRGVTLTPAGRLLSQRASAILDMVQTAYDDVTQASHLAAATTIRIGAFPTAISSIVLPARQHLPASVRLQIVDLEPEHALSALAARTIDAAIVDRYGDDAPPVSERVDRATLLVEPLRVVHASHRRPRSLAGLAHVPWVLGGPGSRLGRAAKGACRAAGFEPDVVVESDDHHVAFDVIRAENAVALLPDLALLDLPPGIRVARSIDTACVRSINFVTRHVPQRSVALAQVEAALSTAVGQE